MKIFKTKKQKMIDKYNNELEIKKIINVYNRLGH